MRHLILTLFIILAIMAQAQKKTSYDKALDLHNKGSYSKAFAAFNKEAAKDCVPAMYYTALYNEKGIAVDTNYTAAIALYKSIIDLQDKTKTVLLCNDIKQLVANMLPQGKKVTDMTKEFAESAKDNPLSTEEIFQYAVYRESLLKGEDAAPESEARKSILSSYITAAGNDYQPALYRAATLLETSNPKNAAMYYRWACYEALGDYKVDRPARIATQSISQNTMTRRIDGKPNEQHYSPLEQYEVEPGNEVGGLTIINVTSDHISFETHFDYISSGSYKPKNKFVVDRGETLKLIMTGVSDMHIELHVTYKK